MEPLELLRGRVALQPGHQVIGVSVLKPRLATSAGAAGRPCISSAEEAQTVQRRWLSLIRDSPAHVKHGDALE
eukprot:2925953-Alexandrium_andersonii.AAC.1